MAFGSVVVLLGLALLLPVPYIKMSPGPTFNTIGEIDGEQFLQISGTQTYPVDGHLDMTTVLETGGPRGGMTLFEALGGWFNGSNAVLPRELLYPDDIEGEQVDRQQAALMSTSKSDAIGAALTYLDRPVDREVVITLVYLNSPADGKLQPSDRVLTVNGQSITEPSQVAELVQAQPAGSEFVFEVERMTTPDDTATEGDTAGDGDTATEAVMTDVTETVTSAVNPENGSTPYLGVVVSNFYTAPFDVDFTLEDVGGPSAGLMFTLALIDKLTPENLADGEFIAGTGTISPDGQVGPIGGIRQKLVGARDAGATLFLMPTTHCEEAQGHIPEGLAVSPVDTLTDALDAIETYTAGGSVPSCPSAA